MPKPGVSVSASVTCYSSFVFKIDNDESCSPAMTTVYGVPLSTLPHCHLEERSECLQSLTRVERDASAS